MTLEDVSRIDDAIERIRKAIIRIEQEIARYNISVADEWTKKLEQLCSFIYAYQVRAKKKKQENLPLTQAEETILKMELEKTLQLYIPTLHYHLKRYYPQENIYGHTIHNIKNIKQSDCINSLWTITKALQFKVLEYEQPAVIHESIFQKVKL
jgi:cell division protein FtsI/penicillin-binding protein 2